MNHIDVQKSDFQNAQNPVQTSVWKGALGINLGETVQIIIRIQMRFTK